MDSLPLRCNRVLKNALGAKHFCPTLAQCAQKRILLAVCDVTEAGQSINPGGLDHGT